MSWITYTAKRSLVGSGNNIIPASYSNTAIETTVWVNSGIAVVPEFAVSVPDLVDQVDIFTEIATTGYHGVHTTSYGLVSSGPMMLSVYTKPNSRSWCSLMFLNKNGVEQTAFYNVSSGTIGTVSSGITATMTSVGSGWYRVAAALTVTSGSTVPRLGVRIASADAVSSFTGVASVGMYFFGIMVNSGTTLRQYPHVYSVTYTMSFEVEHADRQTKFELNKNVSLSGITETLLHRQDVTYGMYTAPIPETSIPNWREFLGSVAAAESFTIDIYGSVDSNDNPQQAILDATSFTEDRIGSLSGSFGLYRIGFSMKLV